MPRDKTRIYLSSTFEDLKAHRAAVYTALSKAGYEVQSMEHYTASDQRPADKCLADVAEADVYLGLFAFRYGYVPPVEHGNPQGLSITELEYRCAESKAKPRFIFLADGDSEEQAWPKRFDDHHTGAAESGAALGRFKQHLKQERLCSTFGTPENLATSVLSAISQWSLQAKTSSHAAAAAAAPVRWNIDEQQSPFPGLRHFGAQHATVYFGREADVDTLLFRLNQGANRFLLVSGDSGTGKSSLVDAGLRHALMTRAATQPGRTLAFQRMLPTAGTDLWDALARSLKTQAEALGLDDFALAASWRRAPATLGAGLQTLARGRSGKGELIVFIDQMEELFTGRADEPRTQQAAAFLSALHAAAQDPAHGLQVIGTIRSDFLHHCHHHPELKACLSGGAHHAIGRAQPWMLKDMITKPAAAAGLAFESGLVDQLLEDAGQQTGSLSLLAFAL